MKKIETLKSEAIVRVARQHAEMFERRLASGSKFVNVTECEMYKKVWQAIIDQEGKDLSSFQRGEVLAAFLDGGYFTDEDHTS